MGFSQLAALFLSAVLSITAVTTSAQAATPARDGKWIDVNGVTLRYELSGKGKADIVLIHDMGMNLEVWDEILPAISKGTRILRYDMRGFGLSEKFRGEVSIDNMLEDLRQLIDAVHLNDKVILIGGSVGGAMALKFAARYPDRVRAVVGINAVVRLNRSGPPANPALLTRDTPKLIESEGVRAYLKSDLDWLYPSQLQTPERMQRFMGIEVAQDPQARAMVMRMKNASADIDTELPKIPAPTLLIAGMLNSSYTADDWKEIAGAIPKARLEMINSGHHAAFESPELVGPLLKSFIDLYD